MKLKLLHVTAAAFIAFTLMRVPAAFGQVSAEATAFVKKWDRSGKGLLDLKAIMNAAMVKFEYVDKDHTGRLTEQQLSTELTPREFRAANPDGDKTIGAEEWFNLVRRRFQAANPDHDGSISVAELETPQGKRLLKLLQNAQNP
ncbi:MAG TPA: EF-hand domain-containing protein [Steroidobacteraceae bacterium]|nr:EF-hand domain-containing protein [Steroidobacteraceae bacterium]